MRFRLTNKAVEDLSKIWNYTYEIWSENQADYYYKMLIASCQKVAENPNLGNSYDEIFQNLLGYKAGRHILFYRVVDHDYVEITRVLHQKMDLQNRIVE